MGNSRPVKTICWEKFLTSRKCYFDSVGKHYKWKCPGCRRSIIFRGADKEIPFTHIQTNLRTLNVSPPDFWDWVTKNC